ncbi:MAG: hypothetical protein FJ109_05330 [Deltaproteobacteria bacterium]|nr:hypothetical protein [Deltaproteobacteria bacterium]
MKTTAILAAVLVLVPLVLTSPSASADGGPMAEVRLGTDVGLSKPPWLMGSVLVGWRISERWSAGVSYSPLRVIHQDMQVLNDVSAAPISLSGLHAYGDFWFKTHASWGGRVGAALGVLTPDLGVAEPGNDMSGGVVDGLLSASWGFMGGYLGCQVFASVGWKWGQLENNTHEHPMIGNGPIIIDQVDVFAPTFMAGLALAVWL